MFIVSTSFGWHGVSSRRLWSYSTSSHTLSKSINLDFFMNVAIYVYFEDFHDITSPIVNMYPLVVLVFFASNIRFALNM